MNKSSESVLRLEGSLRYFGWRVLLGAAVGLAFSPGPVSLIFIGALAPDLAHRFGWSFGQIMFSLTLLNLASIPAAPLAGRFIDRFGARGPLFFSLAGMALCLFVLGNGISSLPVLYATTAVFGFVTIGAQSLTYTKLITGWFDRYRGIALGIASSGLGIGYAILPIIVSLGSANLGLEGSAILLAAIIILFPLALNFFVAHPNPTLKEPEGKSHRPVSAASLTLREAARTRHFWIIAGTIMLVAVIATGIVPQFPNIARDLSYSPGEAAAAASAFGIATLTGRLVVGWLFDRMFAPRVASLFFFLAAIGYAIAGLVVFNGLSAAFLIVATVLMGLGFGAESDLIGYLASRYFGHAHFGSIYGALLSIFIAGVALGPFAYGLVRDLTQSYGPMLVACAVVGAMSSILLLMLPSFSTPPMAEKTPHSQSLFSNNTVTS